MTVYKFKGEFLPLFLLIGLVLGACQSPEEKTQAQKKSIENWYLQKLESMQLPLQAILQAKSIESCRKSYVQARDIFKESEPVMQFVDAANYKYLNSPNLVKIEEEDATGIKHQTLTGFQLLEEAIFDEQNLPKAKLHAEQIMDRLRGMHKNTLLEPFEAYHFLWLFRDALLKIASTGTTPFDSPVLDRNHQESALVIGSLQEILNTYKDNFNDENLYHDWQQKLDEAKKMLQNSSADTFDTYRYFRDYNENFLQLWQQTALDWQVAFPFELALNNSASSYFSINSFNPAFFTKRQIRPNEQEFVKLGEELFYENKLSATVNMSCGSCHQKDKSFSDGLKLAPKTTRNTPTLLYAGWQHQFFYDARSGSLEGQIISVIENPNEFHSDITQYYQALAKDSYYQQKFNKLFKRPINDTDLRDALAAYVRSLGSFNSKFDKNIRGEAQTLTDSEKRGFNLFMGKAQCGTCHFAPFFNGTVPPKFTETELEHIGVPAKKNLDKTKIDADLGRYYVFNTKEKKYFFKTPSLRNIEKTAPYMHNGVFDTLEEVVDFYDRGGGNGVGFQQQYQTLPDGSLQLKPQEKKDLVAFMKTLTDF